MFNDVQADIYGNDNGDMFMTARQLGECLEYANPMKAINNLIERNPYLKGESFSTILKLRTVEGNRTLERQTRVFNEDGIYEIAFLSNTDKALEFRCWVRSLLKALRTGAMTLVSQTADMYQMMSQEISSIITNIREEMKTEFSLMLKNELSLLEVSLRPQKPNCWLWKKHIATPLIETLAKIINKDIKDTYDLVYDTMKYKYGFDKSFTINQFCAKYGLESASVIDAVADMPEYQYRFTAMATTLINRHTDTYSAANMVNSPAVEVPVESIEIKSDVTLEQEVKLNDVETEVVTLTKPLDKVQETIQPLIELYDDKSFNGAKTYGKVYDLMKTKHGWKTTMTRNHCSTKKAVILKNEKLFKQFSNCVQQLLSEYYAVPTV